MKDYSYFVFETPKDCFSCPFLICGKEHYCEVEDGGRLIECDVCDGKPDWCPLRPLPNKRILPEDEVVGTNYGEEPWFSDGWNACLDAMTGETE